MKASTFGPTFKSLMLENPRLTMTSGMLSTASRRIFKICSKSQCVKSKTYAQIASQQECSWDEAFRISTIGGDQYVQFEIFEEHVFGYNPQQLLNVWSGTINVQAYFGDNKTFDVLNTDLQKVGSLTVRVKSFSDAPKQVEEQTQKVEARKVEVQTSSKTIVMAGNSPNPEQQSKTNKYALILNQISKPVNSASSRIQIYSMVASLKGLDANRDAVLALQSGQNMVQSSVAKNRGLQPVWVETIKLPARGEQTLEVHLLFCDEDGEKEQIAVGTEHTILGNLSIEQVKQKKHILSKQVQLTQLGTNKKCGVIYFDIHFKEKEDPALKMLKRSQLYESIDQTLEAAKGSFTERRQPFRTRAEKLVSEQIFKSPMTPRSRVKRSAVKGQNGYICFPKAERFDYWVNSRNPNISYIDIHADNYSFFAHNQRKGTELGRGAKYDFTKEARGIPGVGNYRLPSMWDKYDWQQP